MRTPIIKKKANSKHPIILISRWALSFLKWITFKKLDLQYDSRTTTIGCTIYTGTKWEKKDFWSKSAELAHEVVHVDQWVKYWILYPITYMLSVWSVLLCVTAIILSLSWTWCIIAIIMGCLLPGPSPRLYWEYKAFQATLSVKLHNNIIANTPEDKRSMTIYYARLICDRPYYYAGLFMYPFVQYRLWNWFRMQ